MPKEKLLEYYALTDLFFLTNYENIKGWYPVKLFEYYQSKTPILLCPSDNDVLADFITTTNCGFIANNVAECENILLELYRKKSTEGAITTLVNEQVGLQYSRAYQTSLLAKLIHQLTEKNKLNPIV